MSSVLKRSGQQAEKVRQIVSAVAQDGDEAVADFTARFDGVKLSGGEFRIAGRELQKSHAGLDKDLLATIQKAIENVRKYQSDIFIGNLKRPAGIKYTALNRVGICVPGALAPLPSTVIMTAVPAIVAGVSEIAVMSSPSFNGSIHPVILGVCFELGIKEVYRIGGAQGVAALAWGTESVKKVDKIVGPGNLWGQLAKREVFGVVDIDSVAGPSEVLVVANKDAKAAWVASDMLSQAEHGADSSAIVVTDSRELAEGVIDELKTQVLKLERVKEAMESLLEFSGVVVVSDIGAAVEIANDFAAEHLQVQCGSESSKVVEQIKNAGAIFIGDYSPVAVGDYWAGPSHTLPTGMSAKFFSALSSNDFIKSSSIIEYDEKKLAANASDIIRFAQIEGLSAHANSVRIRQQGK